MTRKRQGTSALSINEMERRKRGRAAKKPVKPGVQSTRERILAYLKENRTTSAVELAHAWGLTRADLRYHLSQLQKDGLIEPAPRDPEVPLGPGRPPARYRLADGAASLHLSGLCRALLALFLRSRPVEERARVVEELARALAGEALPPAALTRRLTQVIHVLNERQYHARWEAHAQGPRILLRNCPYAPLLPEYPELCQMDRQLLEQLLHVQVSQVTRMNLETGQPPACIFAIHLRAENEC